MTVNNLCNSCTNVACEFQSGIVRSACTFYMPPRIEPDNCGNYVVQDSTTKNDLGIDCISRQAVLDLIEHYNSDGLGSVFYGYEEGVKFADAINKLPPVNSQKPILDKIRAEIDGLTYYWCEVRPRSVIDDVLNIIDKYKAESKDKE